MAQQASQARTIPVELAKFYERIVPALAAPWAEDLLDRVAPQPGERVLDVACGTGIVARRAAARVSPAGAVVGVDPDPNMLAVGRATAAAEGVDIDWREGRGEALPVDDAAFDVVCCQHGLQFFQDPVAGLQEMRRALKPGGRLALSVGQGIERQPLHAALDEIVARHLGAPLFGPTIFGLSDPDELRGLLEGTGFRNVTIEPLSLIARIADPAGFVQLELVGAMAFAPAIAEMAPAAREAAIATILAEAEVATRPLVEDGILVIPDHGFVAQARA